MRHEEPEPLSAQIVTPLPGPKSQQMVDMLACSECPSLTARRARRREKSGLKNDPIVWTHTKGVNVVDADGNVFVDWTAGFGVAVAGHGHSRIIDAIQAQSERALHALGDVYPSDVKVDLMERLCAIAPFPNARVILGQSGSDAVEAALKTAMLATKKPGVLAFRGGYHGLSHGPLALCGYNEAFREPFAAQLNPHVVFAPYPREGERALDDALADVSALWNDSIGAVIVEPVQARGGVIVPPAGFLKGLRELAHARGALLIVDEIYTGLARCGTRWLCAQEDAVPDLLCAGKALGGGMPMSACLGTETVMEAWGDPDGEALHTGTFLGHPLACAAALASLDVIEEEGLAAIALEKGKRMRAHLEERLMKHASVKAVRGVGLLIGVELTSGRDTLRLVRSLLEKGHLTLPAGRDAEVLSLTPPVTMPYALFDDFLDVVDACLRTP